MKLQSKFALFLIAVSSTFVTALDFTNAGWIWTNEISASGLAPQGTRAFRRDVDIPPTKVPLVADLVMAVDDSYILWVNGQQVGSGNNWLTGQGYCVPLSPLCKNVFAVSATNAGNTNPGGAGLISTIQIGYTDGTTDTIITDASWKTPNNAAPPSGFEQPSFNTASWAPATLHKIGPWRNITISAAPARPSNLSLANANWIGTNEPLPIGVPLVNRVFRKTISLPNGKTTSSAKIIISAGVDYKLYVQGSLVSSKASENSADTELTLNFPPTSVVTIAVVVASTSCVAGLKMAIRLDSADCVCAGCPIIVTDGSWKVSLQVDLPVIGPLYLPGFDDSAWSNAVLKPNFDSIQCQ